MRIKSFLLLSVFASFSILQSSWNNIDDTIRNAVVKIFVAEKQINWFYPYNINSASSTGTGFFINELGYIITCAHVVKDASSVFIGIDSGTKVSVLTPPPPPFHILAKP